MALTDFQEAIAAKVAGINGTVLDRVVDHYAEIEATRRVPLLIAGLAEEEKQAKALNKFQPENTYNEQREVIGTFWTKAALDARDKATQTLKKWRDALAEAIVDSKYEALEKLVKSGGQNNGKPAAADAEA
jgi:hypothetical protein